jgi:hypothetical protein
MRAHRIFRAGAVLALLGGAGGLQAQDASSLYSYTLKIRAGLTAGDIQKTHFDNKVLGFGAEARRETVNGQAILAELVWEYVPGRHHDVMRLDSSLNLDTVNSYDNRKEYGQGFSLRCAYSFPVTHTWFHGFEWFAGINIDSYKVRSEFKYTLKNSGVSGNPLYEGGGGTFMEEGSQIAPGAFVGLKYRIGDEIGAEMSLRNFGMKHFDFTPGAYIGSSDGKMETGVSRGWALEFAISVKL